MIKVLLDTDIGDEVDDAACLAYLLAQPRCDLQGVTTTGSKPCVRALIAKELASYAGHEELTVLPGADSPLFAHALEQQPWQWSSGRIDASLLAHGMQRNRAVPFMREVIRRNPGEVVLLSIAPLTNIALLFALDPEIAGLVKQHVVVCGDFGTQGVWPPTHGLEWNAKYDPEAAASVYRSSVANNLTVGQDTARWVGLSSDEIRQSFRAPVLGWILDFADETTGLRRFVRLDDAVAAVTVFEPAVASSIPAEINFSCGEQEARSAPSWQPSAAGRHHLVRYIDRPMFFQRFFAVFPSS